MVVKCVFFLMFHRFGTRFGRSHQADLRTLQVAMMPSSHQSAFSAWFLKSIRISVVGLIYFTNGLRVNSFAQDT